MILIDFEVNLAQVKVTVTYNMGVGSFLLTPWVDDIEI